MLKGNQWKERVGSNNYRVKIIRVKGLELRGIEETNGIKQIIRTDSSLKKYYSTIAHELCHLWQIRIFTKGRQNIKKHTKKYGNSQHNTTIYIYIYIFELHCTFPAKGCQFDTPWIREALPLFATNRYHSYRENLVFKDI